MTEFEDLSKTNLQALPELDGTELTPQPQSEIEKALARFFSPSRLEEFAAKVADIIEQRQEEKRQAEPTAQVTSGEKSIVQQVNERFGGDKKEPIVLTNDIPPDPESPYRIKSVTIR